jgi:hypothetical protein
MLRASNTEGAMVSSIMVDSSLPMARGAPVLMICVCRYSDDDESKTRKKVFLNLVQDFM